MPNSGWLYYLPEKSGDLYNYNFQNFKFKSELTYDANAEAISRIVKKIRQKFDAGSLHIGWDIASQNNEKPDDRHRYDVASYNASSTFIREATSLNNFVQELLKKLKIYVDKFEKKNEAKIEDSSTAMTAGDPDLKIYIYIKIYLMYNTRSEEKRTEIDYQPIQNDDPRIVAPGFARNVADHVEKELKNIVAERKWDKKPENHQSLKVGKSFIMARSQSEGVNKDDIATWSLSAGIGNRWQTSYKNKYDVMIPLVILTDADLPDCLKNIASDRKRKDGKDPTVGDSRDVIALDIEDALARRGTLCGYKLGNDPERKHPTPKEGGGDASVVYLVHRNVVDNAVNDIEAVTVALDQLDLSPRKLEADPRIIKVTEDLAGKLGRHLVNTGVNTGGKPGKPIVRAGYVEP